MVWRAEGPQGNEAAKVRWDILPYTRGKVLDLGCGPEKAFPHFIGVDSCKDTELFGIDIRPDLKVDDCARISESIEPESCDAIFSSHLLEHIEDFAAALRDWWGCIRVGGHLVLYLPHKDLYPNIGEPGANPDHRHDFEPCDITQAMNCFGWDLVVNEVRDEGDEYSFLMVFEKRADHRFLKSYLKAKPAKPRACVVRYGGYGDMLQAANALPALKRQGYHVTVMTTPGGQEILREDQNIDDWYIQDKDQVPNHLLSEFWRHVSRRFEKFINLCESVEGTLIAMPGRANHAWPLQVRHAMMNRNYLEFTADLAGVPYSSEARFYPTKAEIENARARLLPGGLNLVWALSGSACHKFYPGQDIVMARILTEFPECRIFLVGDETCKLLEQGWEKEERVVRLSGETAIRDTLALAQAADCVVGCETGVLNAVAFEVNRKVVLLSHSSHENLTKHWRNTAALAPTHTRCYPCHRLHYTREFCPPDPETGAAACQREIHPADVFDAVRGGAMRHQEAA
jgi:ADP-heptose:LPS heptosyltransferase/predicted SAM-dependent methyltransferase